MGIGPCRRARLAANSAVSDAVEAIHDVQEGTSDRRIACPQFVGEEPRGQVRGLGEPCALQHVECFNVERSVAHESTLLCTRRATCSTTSRSRIR